ncbi:MAG: hypothetical protein HZA14_12475 [Nitrospirae bacterium]|nr:hypothetical protein [Nitrospirota bacterium]
MNKNKIILLSFLIFFMFPISMVMGWTVKTGDRYITGDMTVTGNTILGNTAIKDTITTKEFNIDLYDEKEFSGSGTKIGQKRLQLKGNVSGEIGFLNRDNVQTGFLRIGYQDTMIQNAEIDLTGLSASPIGRRSIIDHTDSNDQIYGVFDLIPCKAFRFTSVSSGQPTDLQSAACDTGYNASYIVTYDYIHNELFVGDGSAPTKIAKFSTSPTFAQTGGITMTGNSPYRALAVDGDNKILYAINYVDSGTPTLVKIDTVTMTIIASLTMSTNQQYVQSMFLDKELGYLYLNAANATGILTRVLLSDFATYSTVVTGEAMIGTCYDPSRKILYSVDEDTQMYRTNLRTFAVMGSPLTISGALALSTCAIMNGFIYVADEGTNPTAKSTIWKVNQETFLLEAQSLPFNENYKNSVRSSTSDYKRGRIYWSTVNAGADKAMIPITIVNTSKSMVVIGGNGKSVNLLGSTLSGTFYEFLGGNCNNTTVDTGDEICAIKGKYCANSWVITNATGAMAYEACNASTLCTSSVATKKATCY